MNRRIDGTTLSDRYELTDQLGAGGMAEVYLGRDRVLGRTVAVKTLLTQYASDPHFIERFRREAQNAAALNHPNVVGVYDTGSDDGTHFIVMEYVEGKTLRDVIREEGPLLPERVAEIGADVCSALALAHQHGIIHRDVKPANIMITPAGGVKVTDFGIARAVSGDTVTQTAMVLGTAQYFSPEQAQSQPVDQRSDLYSLGVVLYEMLTRQVPFTGSSPVAIAYKHVKETPVVPSRLNPDVPPDLEAIVMKALAKNPDNRYQSAQEMREDLLRALHGRPVQATPVMADATGMINLASDETVIVQRAPTPVIRHEPTPEERKRKRGILLLVLIGIAIAAIVAWALMGLLGGGEPELVVVPDVIGEPISDAQDTLESRGFEVRILDPVPSDKHEDGRIVEQDPPALERAARGATVSLTPSSGPKLVEVPNLSGRTVEQARDILKKAGLELGDQTQEQSSRAFGTIIAQNPSASSNVKAGTKVNVVTSSGPPTVTVPDVRSYTEEDARNRLEDVYDFKVQVIYEDSHPTRCNQPPGYVCRQTPRPDTRVQRGSTVTIYVAEEPEPEPSPTEELPTSSPSPSPS